MIFPFVDTVYSLLFEQDFAQLSNPLYLHTFLFKVPLTPFSLSMLNKTYYISKTFCEEKN
jgi:hypothetical protein